jgi:precorrin-3B C17-methyltransferase / cobalt-factor III methyltransferase
VPLPEAKPEMADMRTMVIVGSSQTRVLATQKGGWVYTPRSVPT